MKLLKTLAALLTVSLISFAQAGNKITVAGAASLKNALSEVAESYKKAHPGEEIDFSYGASGKLTAQIQQGAPFDLFCAADMEWPEKVAKSGFGIGAAKAFAMGRLILWSGSIPEKELSFQLLTTSKVQRIAVANPKLAPYGARTVEALNASGIYAQVQPKLIYGENISQAAQYAVSGATQVGFFALSLAVGPDMKGKGHYVLVPENLHQPLAQGFILLKRGANNPLAKSFASYLLSPQAQAIFHKHGFTTPAK